MSLCTKVCLQNACPPSVQILQMRFGKRRPSPKSGRRCLMAGKVSRESSRPILHSWNHQNWADCRENLRTCYQEILWRSTIAPNTYSSSERQQLRFNPCRCWWAYKDGTIQANANNNECTRVCRGFYRPYSLTRSTMASLTRLYFEA